MSLWRELLHKELSGITVEGRVLDLGGSKNSKYHKHLKGNHAIAVANLNTYEQNYLHIDLERPFPTKEASYDGILCINVLEHIFDYRNVLSESFRTLKRDGVMVLAVPFLIRVHPSPHDYWRYTGETLERIFVDAGFKDVKVTPIGTGVFGASYSLKHNLFKVGILQAIGKGIARFYDALVVRIRPGVYTKKHYPLGYVVVARK